MKHVVAIDLGGTKTHGALIDEQGRMIKNHKIATNPSKGKVSLLAALFEMVDLLSAEVSIDGIGIGSAGRIDVAKGSVFYATDNIPQWTGVPLRKLLEERFHVPVYVDDDVNVAGVGEEWLGAAQGYESYVLIALGTGIGASVKVNGALLHGAHWSGGEIGHMTLYPHGRRCNCGLQGCFEQYCSGTALTRMYNEQCPEMPVQDGRALFRRIADQDEIGLRILHTFVSDLATATISLMNIYDPEIIILGGGLTDTRELWWDAYLHQLQSSPLAELYPPLVVPAKLGNLAGMYGAAYLTFVYLNAQNGH